ncbi:MAG TPA: hypothetical protein VF169_01115 [Albitalea sp.]|uniref:hypothetical protein n=1 Tax=Piscinibacter sp. TaxID=1903157 RepID=UPI002ED09E34
MSTTKVGNGTSVARWNTATTGTAAQTEAGTGPPANALPTLSRSKPATHRPRRSGALGSPSGSVSVGLLIDLGPTQPSPPRAAAPVLHEDLKDLIDFGLTEPAAARANPPSIPRKPLPADAKLHTFKLRQAAGGATTSAPAFAPAKPPSAVLQALSRVKPGAVEALLGSRLSAPQAVTKRQLAATNLVAGITTTHLSRDDVPPMDALITFDHPKGLVISSGSGAELVLQRMQMKAHDALNEAAQEVKAAIEGYDRQLKGPIAPEERAALQATCRNILQAQQERVSQLVRNEWAMQQQRDSALSKSNLEFGVKIGFKTAKLATSLGSMALGGVAPFSLVAAGYTVAQMVELVHEYAKDRDAVLRSIESNDLALTGLHNGESARQSTGKAVAKELAGATHIPFIEKAIGPTLHSQEEALEAFLARSARLDKQTRRCYQKALKTLDDLDQVRRSGAAGPDQLAKMDQMREQVAKLLDKLFPLMGEIERDNQLYLDYKANCDGYRRRQPGGVKQATSAVKASALALDLAYVGVNIGKIAKYVA